MDKRNNRPRKISRYLDIFAFKFSEKDIFLGWGGEGGGRVLRVAPGNLEPKVFII